MRNQKGIIGRTRWIDKHWDAHLAHMSVAYAVRTGKLVPGPCEVCGHEAAVAHHDSYAERLSVRWLCAQHHRLWHREHPVTDEVAGPPRAAPPITERTPNRGQKFRRYLKPMALRRHEAGMDYRTIAAELGVAPSTVFKWVKNPNYR